MEHVTNKNVLAVKRHLTKAMCLWSPRTYTHRSKTHKKLKKGGVSQHGNVLYYMAGKGECGVTCLKITSLVPKLSIKWSLCILPINNPITNLG